MDLSAVRRLEKLCFPMDAWPLLDMIGAITMPHILRYKAVNGAGMIGYVFGEVREATQTGWIATLAVHPAHRRQGLGEHMLHLCEKQLATPRIRLTVRSSNTAAIALYQKNAYVPVSRWRNYYKGGEDGVVMEKVFLE